MTRHQAKGSNGTLIVLAMLVAGACVGLALLVVLTSRGDAASDRLRREGVDLEDLTSSEGPVLRSGVGSASTREGATGSRSRQPLPPYTIEGMTRWQRRLSAGDVLQDLELRLRKDDANLIAIGERLGELLDELLPLHERGSLSPWAGGDEAALEHYLRRTVRALTIPRRDRVSFALQMVDDIDHPLGLRALLRIWTRKPGFDRDGAESAYALLERLLRLAGGQDQQGFDVIATGARGKDVFPWTPMTTFPVAGYYAPPDDLIVMRSTGKPAYLALLLKHELVHAWQHRHVGAWRSRFLTEGLADYLAWLEPSDRRLEVPPQRLRHNFRALLTLLWSMERLGIRWSDVQPARLLSLTPRDFYAMGHLGYLLGEATLAFIGADDIETAIQSRSEDVLARAVRRVAWSELLAFVEEHAVGGIASDAMVVRDVAGSQVAGATPARRSSTLSRSLSSLGVRVPAGFDSDDLAQFMRIAVPVPVNDRERIGTALQGLTSAASLRAVIDGTTALGSGFRLAALDGEGPGGLALDNLDQKTRLDFTTALVEELDRLLGEARPRITVVRTGSKVEPTWPVQPQGDRFSLLGLSSSLGRSSEALVLLVASRDAIRPKIAQALSKVSREGSIHAEDPQVGEVLVYLLARDMANAGNRPSAVLVVDLAAGTSDARQIADAFQLHLEDTKVAYWDPQQPLR